ncbi:MAG TPA: flagellar hook capping FlgD N-terminal domain-containing protein, partial [Rhodanobacter sp.]|nr:flagellar hook capping FlgD N-terminal domain-containing protein [Rhodanobacter sp.]
MTIINTGNTASTIGSAATSSAVGSSVAGSMTQADFLKLMTTQLQSQDPTKPVDNSQFVSQMAQFSQLSATQDLLTSMNGLNSIMTGSLQASQLLGSSNLIDRQVLVPSTTVSYSGSTVTGAVNVANAGDVKMSIFD